MSKLLSIIVSFFSLRYDIFLSSEFLWISTTIFRENYYLINIRYKMGNTCRYNYTETFHRREGETFLQSLSHLSFFEKGDSVPSSDRPDPFVLENVVITSVVLFTRHFISCHCLLSSHRDSSKPEKERERESACGTWLISTFPRFVDWSWSKVDIEFTKIQSYLNYVDLLL